MLVLSLPQPPQIFFLSTCGMSAEYTLRNVKTQIAITTDNLPTIEQLEMELNAVVSERPEGNEVVEP